MTITVEELTLALDELLTSHQIQDTWHANFISSVYVRAYRRQPLSSAQAKTVLRISSAYVPQLASIKGVTDGDIQAAISNPTYRTAPYQSSVLPREVRFVGENKLAFRFKLDPMVLNDIKGLKHKNETVFDNPTFNEVYKLWIVPVTPSNVDKIIDVISMHKFQYSPDVLEYLTLCSNSKNVASALVYDDESDKLIGNIAGNPLLVYVVKNLLGGETL